MIPMLVYEWVWVSDVIMMYAFAGAMTIMGLRLYDKATGGKFEWADIIVYFTVGLGWWVAIPFMFMTMGEARAEDKAEIERLKKRRKK